MRLHILALAASAITLAGCATIFNGESQTITIASQPEGASLAITNSAGTKIHSGMTPVTLALKRGAGYFKAETYTIVFSKPGFATKELQVKGTVSGWYIGNLLFGGLIGMLAVDPATGAMYVLPESVNQTLEADEKKASADGRALTIVSTEHLTPQQLAQARQVSPGR